MDLPWLTGRFRDYELAYGRVSGISMGKQAHALFIKSIVNLGRHQRLETRLFDMDFNGVPVKLNANLLPDIVSINGLDSIARIFVCKVKDIPRAGMKTDEVVKAGYVCGVDWQHELGEPGLIGPACKVYNSIEELQAGESCTAECGAVEVEIRLKRWVIPQGLI